MLSMWLSAIEGLDELTTLCRYLPTGECWGDFPYWLSWVLLSRLIRAGVSFISGGECSFRSLATTSLLERPGI